jgi:hypothetical protein
MERFKQNAIYLEKNFNEIEKRYYKFIAIADEKTIGSNRRFEKLIELLGQNCKNTLSVNIKSISKNNYLD